MKRTAVPTLLCLITAALIASGCASVGGSYKLKQTRQDVDWAMVRYHNREAFGFMTPQEKQSVSAAYQAYQSAFNSALKQANGNYNTPTPPDVKQLADQLLSVLDAIP